MSATLLPSWLQYFITIDSTNIYATELIDEGMAQNGDVIWALHQQTGKGQRGKVWEDESGKNIAMSLIVKPELDGSRYPLLSMLTAVVAENYFSRIFSDWETAIKWPNDIYINDKKASGILIENIWKGMEWLYAIIGIGINVNQHSFPENLPNATSLLAESGQEFDLLEIITDLRNGILNGIKTLPVQAKKIQEQYNQRLYKRGKEVNFMLPDNGKKFSAFVQEVDESGNLVLLTSSGIEKYAHGSIIWVI